jgi:hypothetical protein
MTSLHIKKSMKKKHFLALIYSKIKIFSEYKKTNDYSNYLTKLEQHFS